MRQFLRAPLHRWVGLLVLACSLQLSFGALCAETSGANAPESLRAKFMALRDRLDHTPFDKPLLLDSKESSKALAGDVHALIDHPFPVVQKALGSASQWCDILILHPNVKSCSASPPSADQKVTLCFGGKHDIAAAAKNCVHLIYRPVFTATDELRVVLSGDAGPYGTRDYRIMLEAVPADAARTFLHFSYSYLSSVGATLAMESYLGTIGADREGFSVTDTGDGHPSLVRGIRGALERNTMRYYLAIEAYLDTLSEPVERQFEKRLRDWYSSAERYRQLRDLDLQEYLATKLKGLRSQHGDPPQSG